MFGQNAESFNEEIKSMADPTVVFGGLTVSTFPSPYNHIVLTAFDDTIVSVSFKCLINFMNMLSDNVNFFPIYSSIHHWRLATP